MNHSIRKVKIFALPFGGGSKYSYRALERFVPENFEWETIELSGRGARLLEPLLTDIHSMAEDVFRQIQSRLHNLEYLLYGHSMGTLLAYELAKKINESGLTNPVCLFLSGGDAPSKKSSNDIADYERRAFWQEIDKIGGLPKEILQDTQLRDYFEPILRADFKAIERYVYRDITRPLPVPITVCLGKEDGIQSTAVDEWQKETVYKIDAHILPGDHFFIFQHCEHLVKLISNAYTISKSSSPASSKSTWAPVHASGAD